ncbi:unnamed protein product [Echinostoma caproni]|uniref:Nuclease HARBI1 n=1 Tax=Echinostoma caproni TaxID=27848 RepID=A0A183ANA0_9TREM|nr:unnamed protein product [Echinostoma caproni]
MMTVHIGSSTDRWAYGLNTGHMDSNYPEWTKPFHRKIQAKLLGTDSSIRSSSVQIEAARAAELRQYLRTWVIRLNNLKPPARTVALYNIDEVDEVIIPQYKVN